MSGISVELAKVEDFLKWPPMTLGMRLTSIGQLLKPSPIFKVTGLLESASYGMELRIKRVDNKRYQQRKGQWEADAEDLAGPNFQISEGYKCIPHDSPKKSGKEWMSQVISFQKIHLMTSKEVTKKPFRIQLSSGRLYDMELCIYRVDSSDRRVDVLCFSDPRTRFLACTRKNNKESKENNKGKAPKRSEKERKSMKTLGIIEDVSRVTGTHSKYLQL